MPTNDPPIEPTGIVPANLDLVEATTVAETNPKGGLSRPADVLMPGSERRSIRVEGSIESYESFHGSIPVPPPYILEQYEKLHTGAVARFFAHYDDQAAHRLKIESSVIETNNTLAIRGQLFAAGLGFTGLIGSLIVIGLGQGAAGATVATGCLVALVSIFVRGQQSQNQELNKKAALQAKIRQGTANSSPQTEPPTASQEPTKVPPNRKPKQPDKRK